MMTRVAAAAFGNMEIDALCQMLDDDLDQGDAGTNGQLYLECHGDEANDILLEKQINALHRDPELASLGLTTEVLVAHGTAPSRSRLIERRPPRERLACDLCPRSFTRRNLLQDHRSRLHGIADLFPCALCVYKGQRYRHWVKHMKRMHPDAELVLADAGEGHRRATATAAADEPTEPSTGQKESALQKESACQPSCPAAREPSEGGGARCPSEHRCAACGKAFTNRRALRYHKRIHVERRHPCLIPGCGKSFKNSSALNEHRVTVHSVPVYRCPDKGCSKSYALKRDLDYHRRLHSGRYTCTLNDCGRTFRDQHALSLHIKAHVGDRDVRCQHCSYSCIQKYALKLHTRRKHKELLHTTTVNTG